MAITLLRITDFRNLESVDLTPCAQGLNVVCGDNGSGKTSLLEAIYYLSLGRSFRSSTSLRLIRHVKDKFSIFAQLLTPTQQCVPMGIEREINGSARMRVAEKEVASITELASFLPIRLINSQSHQLFELGPIFRRKYLDWGLFYQSVPFFACWRHFERVLKQRNSLLRHKRPHHELDIWTAELVKYGLELNKLRLDYVQTLAPIIAELTHELLSIPNLAIHYLPGWDENLDYESVLAHAYPEEYRLGYTQFGPHRADIDISIQAVSVKHFLSRGQQKLLICAMILAQGIVLAKQANKGLVYLVDDLPAELDAQSRRRLISLLVKQNTQIFVTAIEREAICDLVSDEFAVPMKVFHVEHGCIRDTASGSR